jgi:hypothetical protein
MALRSSKNSVSDKTFMQSYHCFDLRLQWPNRGVKISAFVIASLRLACLEASQVRQIRPDRLPRCFAATFIGFGAVRTQASQVPACLFLLSTEKVVQNGVQLARFRRSISRLNGAESTVRLKINSQMLGCRTTQIATLLR